jgi:hypothetical protein
MFLVAPLLQLWHVVLAEGHVLNQADLGRTFYAESVALTLAGLSGNAVTFTQGWSGTPVQLGVPSITVSVQ